MKSAFLEQVIRTVLETGKTVTFAIEHRDSPAETHVGRITSENPLDDDNLGTEFNQIQLTPSRSFTS